jgi:hypothetical protein
MDKLLNVKVVLGAIAMIAVAFAGLFLLVLIGVFLDSGAAPRAESSFSAGDASFPGEDGPEYDPGEYSYYPGDYGPNGGGSPADSWLSGGEWSGGMSSGTVDSTGQGNHVISIDGQVLDLP